MKPNISSKFRLVLLLLLIIPTFATLLKPGYYNMHDDMQMVRQLELEKCIEDGQIPCRWSPDLGYEYGYPLFNFYPPLPYIVGQTFRTLGFSFMWSVKLTAVVQTIATSISMYLLASYLFGPTAGIISALFYSYAPYHAVNIYVRGAMNEAWASVFFPLIFLFIKKIVDKKYSDWTVIFLSLSIFGLMLSHNPMLFVFVLFSVPWTIFCLWQKHKYFKLILKQTNTFINLIKSALIALALAAFYTLPVIFESSLTKIETMFQGYYNYEVHFVGLYQLFISNFWGDGASVWGTEDGMPFMTGYLHWAIPLLALVLIIYSKIKNTKTTKSVVKKINTNLFIIFLAIFASFLCHPRSIFIWKLLSPIQKIQFPWRFLNLSSFFFSLSAGLSLHYILGKLKFKKYIFLFYVSIIGTLIYINLNYFKPITSGPLTDEQKFSGLAWSNQTTSGIYDYLPNTARIAPLSKADFVVDNISPPTSAEIYGAKKGTDWLFFNANVSSPSTIIIAQLYFPNFKIYDFGKPVDFQIEPEFGRMVLDLPVGNHQIYIKLRNTPVRNISNLISLLSWTSLSFYMIKSYAQKRSNKH